MSDKQYANIICPFSGSLDVIICGGAADHRLCTGCRIFKEYNKYQQEEEKNN